LANAGAPWARSRSFGILTVCIHGKAQGIGPPPTRQRQIDQPHRRRLARRVTIQRLMMGLGEMPPTTSGQLLS